MAESGEGAADAVNLLSRVLHFSELFFSSPESSHCEECRDLG